MATVSLIDTGVQLGRTTGQLVKLGSLRASGYSRTKAGSGYLRVNPFEVQGGNAGDPDEAGTAHRLGDWAGYDHDRLPAASDLEHTLGAGEVTLDWIGATGHDKAPSIVGYKIYVKDTGASASSGPTESETSTDPTSTPDQTQQEGFEVSAVETADVNLASYAGNWVAIAVVVQFNDSDSVHEDTEGASAKAGEEALTGAFEGILVEATGSEPTINSVDQTTDETTCFVGENVDIEIDVTMHGTSTGELQRRQDGGSWSTIDSTVTAGASTLFDNVQSGHNYDYRLRYNAGPSAWSNVQGTSATCTKV